MVELPGLLPGNTGSQWEMSNYGGKNHYGLFYITRENLTSRSSYAFSNFDFGINNFMEDSFNIYSASYRIGTFIY